MYRRMMVTLLGIAVALAAGADSRSAPEQALRERLQAVFPDLEVTRIGKSPIDGLFEVLLGPEVIYATADGRYVLRGDLLDLAQSRNVSEDQRQAARESIFSAIPADEFIEFAPAKPRYTAYVFTDISCGYCRKLHREMPEINRLGIAVRYLAFPRHGLDDAVSQEMESVWCATDRKQALTEAKLGRHPQPAVCKSPVSKQFNLGRAMGVGGTPAVFLSDGRALAGYMPPKDLLRAIEGK
jgi:thiol:disulfide interchange protein DsbC